eukprot:g38292.t1
MLLDKKDLPSFSSTLTLVRDLLLQGHSHVLVKWENEGWSDGNITKALPKRRRDGKTGTQEHANILLIGIITVLMMMLRKVAGALLFLVNKYIKIHKSQILLETSKFEVGGFFASSNSPAIRGEREGACEAPTAAYATESISEVTQAHSTTPTRSFVKSVGGQKPAPVRCFQGLSATKRAVVAPETLHRGSSHHISYSQLLRTLNLIQSDIYASELYSDRGPGRPSLPYFPELTGLTGIH